MNHHKADAAVRRILLETVLDTLKAAKATLTYSQVGNLVGLPAHSGVLHDILTQTLFDDRGRKQMPRCGLIVNKKTGRPGEEFFVQARKAGYEVLDVEIFHDDVLESFGLGPQ